MADKLLQGGEPAEIGRPTVPPLAGDGGAVVASTEGAAGGVAGGAAEIAESREEFLLREEAAVGGTDLARRINAGLRSLARSARSFLLYDPRNEAIRLFLDQYRSDMMGAIQAATSGGVTAEGVELVVRPFELVWNGEIVYLERDRERSLAFRMFRDGVRRLTIQRQVEWDELLRLLQILSIRFTGVRQQEEDIVTLLWKAGFKHIDIVAVEGFTPEDDEADDEPVAAGHMVGLGEEELRQPRGRDEAGHGAAAFIDAPLDFDLPIPPPLALARIAPVPVPPADLEAIQQEATSRALPELSVRLVREMLALVADPHDPTDWNDISYLIEEVRDFLLSEGQLEPLTSLVSDVEALRGSDPERVDTILHGFVDGRALRRIVRSIPAAHTRPPPELLWLLDRLPGNHLDHALAVLAEERSPAARRIGRQVVVRLLSRDPEKVLRHIASDEASVAADLLRAFAEALPARTLAGVDAAAGRNEPDVLFEALRVLERLESSPEVADALVRLLDTDVEEVRLRTLEQVAGRRSGRLYARVLETLQRRAHGTMTAVEAEAYGHTLIVLDRNHAALTFEEWIRPRSLFKRVFHDPIGHNWLQWAAVSGMGLVPGEDADKMIRWLAERAGSELAQHCMKTLARRRRERPNG